MKTHCDFKCGKIIDESGKLYFGSSTNKSMVSSLKDEIPFIEILFSSEDQKLVCEEERRLLLTVDAARNEEFFNQTNGTVDWTFHSSEYATYRHKDYLDVYKRLKRDDTLVMTGVYVGTTNGIRFPNHPSNDKKRRIGSLNGFYGKHHSDETKQRIRERNLELYPHR